MIWGVTRWNTSSQSQKEEGLVLQLKLRKGLVIQQIPSTSTFMHVLHACSALFLACVLASFPGSRLGLGMRLRAMDKGANNH